MPLRDSQSIKMLSKKRRPTPSPRVLWAARSPSTPQPEHTPFSEDRGVPTGNFKMNYRAAVRASAYPGPGLGRSLSLAMKQNGSRISTFQCCVGRPSPVSGRSESHSAVSESRVCARRRSGRSGHWYITRSKSETMRVTRQLGSPTSEVSTGLNLARLRSNSRCGTAQPSKLRTMP